jgi:NADP-dependent 3-hydroxy acid dehydrogenase YdfG
MPVSDAQQIQDALKKVLDDYGKIDVYVANAGMVWCIVLREIKLTILSRHGHFKANS